MVKKRIKKQLNKNIDVDDILLDAFNLPKFATESFEGRLMKRISSTGAILFALALLILFIVFFVRTFDLQVINYEKYKKLSIQNISSRIPIFPRRGVITDRYGTTLADNGDLYQKLSEPEKGILVYKRRYTNLSGMSHVLGYLKYPAKDKKGVYWRKEYQGVGGIEEVMNKALNGKIGWMIFQKDAKGKNISGIVVQPAQDGLNIKLSIDAELSDALYKAIKYGAEKEKYKGGAGVIIDIQTGEILALVSYPEFELTKFADNDKEYMLKTLSDKSKPLLERSVLGEYAPGSIVKPGVAISALYEKIISPEKKILSTGELKVQNENDSSKFSIFKDWKAHGLVNMKEAIAHSSDIYFYEIGGGYKDQKGLGIEKIKRYARIFGFGEKTGIEQPSESVGLVPDPKWKKSTFGEKWYLGDTYHTAIGQYGYLVTPIQIARYVASLANYGKLFSPTLIKDKKSVYVKLPFTKEQYNVIHDGMRMSTTIGTARPLLTDEVDVAAKTGTAEIGIKREFKNSWSMGFWPYKNPRFAFAVVLEKGPAHASWSASHSMKKVFDWMKENRFEYLQGKYPDMAKFKNKL